MRRLRVLTWHVHGNYLYYLSQAPHDFYLVTDASGVPGRGGRGTSFPWGPNVFEAQVDALASMAFDVVLYQSRAAWEDDRERLLSPAQQRLPRIYLEHDPPQGHPTDTRHWVDDDRNTLLVHVTAFNALMWDSGTTPVRVIEHGVRLLAPADYSGHVERGIVVVNNIDRRGRRLGFDVYRDVAAQVPLELVGMGSARCGGAGEVPNAALPATMSAHRFFFNPIRYTSLGLAVIEAMLVGVPVIALATTEIASVIRSGENGIVDTRVGVLVDAMRRLLRAPDEARALGTAGQHTARERFGIDRFVADWNDALALVTSTRAGGA